jgi:hypothetical protein
MKKVVVMPNQNGVEGTLAALRAGYDSAVGSGYVDMAPGVGVFDVPRTEGSPGSGVAEPDNSPAIGTAPVSSVYVSSQLPTPTVTGDVDDSQVGSQSVSLGPQGLASRPGDTTGKADFSHTGAGLGSVVGNPHPNNPNA